MSPVGFSGNQKLKWEKRSLIGSTRQQKWEEQRLGREACGQPYRPDKVSSGLEETPEQIVFFRGVPLWAPMVRPLYCCLAPILVDGYSKKRMPSTESWSRCKGVKSWQQSANHPLLSWTVSSFLKGALTRTSQSARPCLKLLSKVLPCSGDCSKGQ